MSTQFLTGWLGIPGGRESDSTKVHVVCKVNGKLLPVCGARLGRRQQFQFCSHDITLHYVECGGCKRSVVFQEAKNRERYVERLRRVQWRLRMRGS